jgi:hypothetical protein
MSYRVHTYADWQNYIANGLNKWERTLYDGQRNRIQYANKWNKTGDIQIVNPWTNRHPLISIHPDDTMTLQGGQVSTHWGGSFNSLDSQSLRYTIWKYAGVQVNRRNFKFYITERDGLLTPSKMQGCRMCSQTGLIDGWCSALHCWDVDKTLGNCPEHPDATISDRDKRLGRHILTCQHGNNVGHEVKRSQQCYSCNGTKKREYGNKKVSVLWDGSPIRVQNGNIYKQPLTELERILTNHVQQSSV